MEESFRKGALAREFLQMQMQGRVATPGTPQKLSGYYHAHLDEFQQPALIVWREIVVKPGDGERAEALRKAASLRDQLQRGADFATLARSQSEGPTAAKGGSWETGPGASISPAVNEALERLPIQQVSPLLEGPHGFHIIRVESRRPAGPKPFEEVQRTITTKLQEEAFRKEMEEYIAKLREHAIVTSMFEGTESAPAGMRDDVTRRASASSP